MLNFYGMPKRQECETSGRRIVHVIPKGPVVEKECLPPVFLRGAKPIRTQLVKIAFSDGSTEMGTVVL